MLNDVHVVQSINLSVYETNVGVFKWVFNLNRNQIISRTDKEDFFILIWSFFITYKFILLSEKQYSHTPLSLLTVILHVRSKLHI